MSELVVVTYDQEFVGLEQINSVREQLDDYGVWYVVVAKGITVEFAKPVEMVEAVTE